jgi:type I restriction enzyme S subunit
MSSEVAASLPQGWEWSSVGLICDGGGGDVQTGPFGSQLHAADYVADGVPLVMPRDLIGGQIDTTKIARISVADRDRLARYALRPNDIVYARRGDLTRRALVAEEHDGWLCGTGCLRIRPGNAADSAFLFYALGAPSAQEWISRHAVGATMPNLNTEILRACPVPRPPLGEQRHIAAVLNAFDDKITSNERLAAAIVEFVEAAFTRLKRDPAATTMRLGELGAVRGGGTPSTKVEEYWEPAEIVWVTPKDMTALRVPLIGGSQRRISAEGLANSSAKLLPRGTVLYTSRATLGHVAIADRELATNQGFISVEPGEFSAEFILMTLRDRNEAIIAKANGSTFLEVNKTNFKAVDCVRPSASAREKFDRVAGPAMRKVAAVERETRALRAIRDELLPKLVSGEIRIPADADEALVA